MVESIILYLNAKTPINKKNKTRRTKIPTPIFSIFKGILINKLNKIEKKDRIPIKIIG